MITAEAPAIVSTPPGPACRSALARLRTVDAPWTEARRRRRAERSGVEPWPIVLDRASGANVWDLDGNRYLDLVAGFGSALLGHDDPDVRRAIEAQGQKLAFGLGDVHPSEAKITLVERLAGLFPEPGARVMLGLTGADAIDAALKTALLYTGHPGVVAFEGGYHGLSTGPLAVQGYRAEFRAPFQPLLSPHVSFARYPRREDEVTACLAQVEQLLRGGAAAVVVEPVLGRGGIVVPPVNFLPHLRALTIEHGALLIVDEIWTGLGRSGEMLLVEAWGVVPDVVCLGKGLGGGMPVSACIGRGEVMAAWQTPSRPSSRPIAAELEPDPWHGEAIHTATHFGNPLGCAAGLAVLDALERRHLPDRARRAGALARDTLRSALGADARVREVRGVGWMIGIELEGDGARGLRIAQRLLERGYLVLTGGDGNVLTLTPPLELPETAWQAFAHDFADVAAHCS